MIVTANEDISVLEPDSLHCRIYCSLEELTDLAICVHSYCSMLRLIDKDQMNVDLLCDKEAYDRLYFALIEYPDKLGWFHRKSFPMFLSQNEE